MSPNLDLDQPFVTDTATSARFPIYTRANAVDVWPGTLSPLNSTTQTSFEFERAWRRALIRFGAFEDADFDEAVPEIMGNFFGYTYLNLSVQQVFGVRMPGLDADTMTAAFLGSAEEAPAYVPSPLDENADCTARIGQTIAWILGAPDLPRIDELKRDVERWQAERPDLAELSDQELLDYATPFVTSRFYPLIEEHLFLTTAGSVPMAIIHAAAAGLGEPGLAMRVLSGLGGVESAAPTFAMWDLSRIVARSVELTKFFDEGIEELLTALGSEGSEATLGFLGQFTAFLDRYGSRCSNEWDLGELDWASNPSLPLAMIDRMRLQPDAASPHTSSKRLTAERISAVDAVTAKLEGDPQAQASFLAAVQAAQVFVPARERSKATCVLLLQPARHALQEFGKRMIARGYFAAADDFTMLRLEELRDFLGDPAAWSAEIRRRRSRTAALDDLEPPFISVGTPPPPSTWDRREIPRFEPLTTGEVIVGVTGCQGIATGVARVLHSPADGADLQPGDVLIAAATDPGWTPLFVSAAAVVVDTGAPLSHAAIVSRELGVPCVIAAAHASRRIPDGARVCVDGTAGTVTILAL